MQKNLVLIDQNDEFDTFYNYIVFLIKKFFKVKVFDENFYYKLKLRKLLKKNKDLKKRGFSILNIDSLSLVRYQISPYKYKEKLKNYLKKASSIFEKIEKKIKKNKILYKGININYAFHNHHNVSAALTFFDYLLSLELLLKKSNFRNIYIPQNSQLLYLLIKLIDKEKNVNLHYYSSLTIENLLNKINIKYKKKILNLILLIENNLKDDSSVTKLFNQKYIYNKNKKNIAFLYYSLTHKRVGQPLFDYLKKKKRNVLEINPDTRSLLNLSLINYKTKIKSKELLLKIKMFYLQCSKDLQEQFAKLLILYFINNISHKIYDDLTTVNLIRKKLLENNLEFVIILNEVSFQGKLTTLLCKQMNIATLYIPHGSIGENYIFVTPKDCDIILLNSKIEKEFLLDGRLDPKLYADRLIPIGSIYFNSQNAKKVDFIEDAFSKKKFFLHNYKFKILLAVAFDYNKPNYPYMNIKLFNDIFSFLEHQRNYQDYLLIIKLHPTDDIERYRNFFQRKRKITIVVSYKDDIRNLIISSDLFLTTPSTTVLEGILFKVPTIITDYYYSIEENLYNNDKIIKTIRNHDEFIEINKFLTENDFRSEYVNKTYNFGLQFCKNFTEQNLKTINENIFGIMEKYIKNKKNQR